MYALQTRFFFIVLCWLVILAASLIALRKRQMLGTWLGVLGTCLVLFSYLFEYFFLLIVSDGRGIPWTAQGWLKLNNFYLFPFALLLFAVGLLAQARRLNAGRPESR